MVYFIDISCTVLYMYKQSCIVLKVNSEPSEAGNSVITRKNKTVVFYIPLNRCDLLVVLYILNKFGNVAHKKNMDTIYLY